MSSVSSHTISNGDTEISVVTEGTGPLIVCVHGWPERWFSWRKQMTHFASLGFQVAAIDVRGYGGSSKPTDIASYRLTELCADVAAVVARLSDEPAILFGHDWGAPIVYNTARLHPDYVRAVAGLSVPYLPVGPASSIDLWKQVYADRFFYQTYFQEPGVAEAEFSNDSARVLRTIYHSLSGAGDGLFLQEKPPSAQFLDGLVDPENPPLWLDPEHFLDHAASLDDAGWCGPLNRYRAQSLDAAEIGGMANPELPQPTTFIGGELDPVRRFMPGLDLFTFAPNSCLDFRGTTIVPGAGHWVQQEAPEPVNAALSAFVAGLNYFPRKKSSD